MIRSWRWPAASGLDGWTAAALISYVIGFSAFQPVVFTSPDESAYVEQAVTFARGSLAWTEADAIPPGVSTLSPYPPGTSIVQAAFVLLGGWRAALWTSVIAVIATVWVTGLWLRQMGYSPRFALLVLGYAPTLALGRVASSDVPSAALVALGGWLFWTGSARAGRWFLAGLVAGLSLLFRETNGLIFLPLFLAAALRREPRWRLLIAGSLIGVAVRLLVFDVMFGSPFFVRDIEGWSLAAPPAALPLYALALLVLVPGGLLAVLAYRGPRRLELMTAVGSLLAIYVFANYSGQSSAWLPRIAAAGRYLIPLLPLIALAWTDVVSRRAHISGWQRLGLAGSAAVVAAAFAVHPVMYAWSSPDAAIVRDIYRLTADGDAVIASNEERKYISPVYGQRARLWIADTPVHVLPSVVRQYPSTSIVLVSRTDTPSRQELAVYGEAYLDEARRLCRLDRIHDEWYGPARRLRVWRVPSCAAGSESSHTSRS